MRNPNGYGSIYKMNDNRRKPWRVVVTVGYDEKGRTKRYTVGYFATRKEANIALAEYHERPIGERRDVTLGEIYQEWISMKKEKVEEKTWKSYQTAWNHLQRLSDEKMADIRLSHLQNVINQTKLSYSSVSKIKILAVQLWNYARGDDIVTQNYAELIKLPKNTVAKKKVFNDEQIKTFWKNKEMPFVDSILVMIYTGMRVGEMLTLSKFTIDLAEGIISHGSKTEAGKGRVIPIHPLLTPIIADRMKNSSEWLFHRNGKQIKYNYYLEHIYYPILEVLKMPKLSPNSCRHTFASLLNRYEENKVNISRLMGHTDYSLTANIYTHSDISDLQASIRKIK